MHRLSLYYIRVNQQGRTLLSRTGADDALYPKLTVDEDGVIRVGSATSSRISTPGALAKAVGPRPPKHQIHHLVPDAVVRDHPLFEAARKRGSPAYNLDRGANGVYLPNGPNERIPGISDQLPVHGGSHPGYNRLAKIRADAVMNRLIEEFGSLDKVPADRLTQACARGRLSAERRRLADHVLPDAGGAALRRPVSAPRCTGNDAR